jgi:hypothetical protein
MINISEDALLAAQICPKAGPGGRVQYLAMVSVSKGRDKLGAAERLTFDTPQEALAWLKSKLDSVGPLLVKTATEVTSEICHDPLQWWLDRQIERASC